MTNNPTDDSRPWSVFLIFLRLGLTSFGGPIAHLGYFRAEFVTRRRWLSERSYADLVALCQFGTVAKLAMRQPFVLFKGLTFQKL
ncbi:chromate transporter, partial [Klebsiella pneumoniae]|uniref:chromate transporter n=1 Tax=Klebsiella pneumoniae TaxID=573 RepID=UPI001D0CF786